MTVTSRLHAYKVNDFDPAYPEPTGWRVLVKVKDIPATSKGGIYFHESTKEGMRAVGMIGRVLAVGPLAYVREDMKDAGPWVKPGDWVLYGKYSGLRMTCKGHELRLMNDDEILGLVPDPEEIKDA